MATPSKARSSGSFAGESISFDVTLPRNLAVQALQGAGLLADDYRDLSTKLLCKAVRPVEVPSGRAEAQCRYMFSKHPVIARVTVLRYGLPTDLRIEVNDKVIGKKIRDHILAFSARHNQKIVAEREHTELRARIAEILNRDGLTYDKLRFKKAVLTRRAVESLMQLCRQFKPRSHMDLHDMLTYAAKADREFVARWLIEQFKKPNADDQLGVRIYEVAVPQVADDLIRVIQDRRYGDRRGSLCMSLVKTKHPRAADVITSVIGQQGITRWALECLGKFRATEHVGAVRKYVNHPDPDIRKEAGRTLKKLGVTRKEAPPPVHLVKNPRSRPKRLQEWSTNLDIEELNPILKKLARCIDKGFGPGELAEVAAVVDEMKLDQTKTFRFPITHRRRASQLWLVIFMDDTDSPDLEVYASPDVIKKLESAVGKKFSE